MKKTIFRSLFPGFLCFALSSFALPKDPPPNISEYQPYVDNLNAKNLTLLGNGKPFALPSPELIAKYPDLWPSVPPSQNAAALYVEAFTHLYWPMPSKPVPGSKRGSSNLDVYGGDPQPLRDWLKNDEKTIALTLAGAAMKTCQFAPLVGTEIPTGGIFYETPVLSYLETKVWDAAFLAEIDEKFDQALELHLAHFRMARQQRAESLHSMSAQFSFIVASDIERLIAHHEFPPEKLKEIIAACDDFKATPEMAKQALRKILLATEFCWQPGNLPKEMNPDAPALKDLPRQLAFERKYFSNAALLFDLPLKDAVQPGKTKSILKTGLGPDQTSLIFSPEGFRETIMWRGYQTANIRMLKTYAAMELFKKANGAYPEKIAQLSPDYLATVPNDPFTDEPLSFKRTADGWLLWSVGEDMADNGGDDTQPMNPHLRPKDIVLKYPMKSNIQFRSERPAWADWRKLYAVAEELCVKGDVYNGWLLTINADTYAQEDKEDEHPDLAVIKKRFAKYYRKANQFNYALEAYKRAVAIQEKVFGAESIEVADTLNDWAETCSAYFPEAAQAEPLYKRSLAIREKLFGADSPKLLPTLDKLAEAYKTLWKYPEAAEVTNRAERIRASSGTK